MSVGPNFYHGTLPVKMSPQQILAHGRFLMAQAQAQSAAQLPPGVVPPPGSAVFLGAAGATGSMLPSFAAPDPSQPDTLGWRAWVWSAEFGLLTSPHQHTPWPEAELVAPEWSDDEAVRGARGIHARLVPKRWRYIGWPDGDGSDGLWNSALLVTGIVERFGRYVLGTTGWRA